MFVLYNFWTEFIYVRCQNCNRKATGSTTNPRSSEPPPRKKPYKHWYPSVEPSAITEDDLTHERSMKQLEKEIAKPKGSREQTSN